MISLQSVSKHFNHLQVIKNIDFQISEGEIVGLLGPNGAGKTTTLKMITGVLPPSSGKITIDNRNPIEDVSIRQTIGYLPENNPLYEEMTVAEWLNFWLNIKRLPENKHELDTIIKKTGLQSVYYRIIGELSKGFRQRTGLAQAMLGNPKILILDEPSEGLDPNQRKEIQTLVKELGSKRTVIISSHVLGEISKMCNRLMIMHQGKIVADGSPEELTAASGSQQIIEIEAKGNTIITSLKKIKGIAEVSKLDSNRYQIAVEGSRDLRLEIFKTAVKNKWELYELTKKQVELEDVFSKLTR
jgi:ABC-2 type transport system ATP-binding protein